MNLMRIQRLFLRLFGDARAISPGRGGTEAHGAQDQHPD